MNDKYKISKFNKVCLYITIASCFLLSVVKWAIFSLAIQDINPDAKYEVVFHESSFLMSNIALVFLLPWIFGWTVWRISGKKENGGNLTYSIFIILLLISMIGQTVLYIAAGGA